MCDLLISDVIDVCRMSFILGIKSDFNDYESSGPETHQDQNYHQNMVIDLIQDFMNNHTELEDVSMTVTKVKGLYKETYGCPLGGEKLYKMTSLYNPLHGQTKEDWYKTIMQYAIDLSEYFQQTACTVIIENYDADHPLQCVYIKNKLDNRRML